MAGTMKLALFLWEGVDGRGKKLNGEMSASSDALVRAKLRREGVRPVKVRRKLQLFSSKKPIKPKNISDFTRQFATMLSSGVPLVQSLDIMARGHDNPSMSEMIDSIKSDVEAGGNLTDAVAKHDRQFSPLYVSLVQAGEKSGTLESLLIKIADYLEKVEILKSKVRKAALYPTIVMLTMVVIVAVLLIFVIPSFEELYNNFGAELPFLTRLVIDFSEFVRGPWGWAMIGLLIFIVPFYLHVLRHSKKFKIGFDAVLLKMPVFGEVARKAALARFARTLGTMYAAGTPLVEAMTSVAGACGNWIYEDATIQLREDIAAGTQLQVALRGQGQLFPPLMVQMIAIGEESGQLDNMLNKVADFYEQEVDDAVEGLSTILEPLLIVMIGVIVGTMVIAMYLPIFQLGQVV